MKKLLLIAATHGNEPIGLEVIKILKKKGLLKYFDTLIANPLALKKGVRFLDCDLNRSYPGNIKSQQYEKRLAAKNLRLAKKYQYIIDLHQADKGIRDFIIIPRKKLTKKFPLAYLDLRDVLLWPEPKGPLGDVLENCLELEFGIVGKDYQKLVNKAAKTVEKFINRMNGEEGSKNNKNIYMVDGTITTNQWDKDKPLPKDFKENTFAGKKFYPLLVNQYSDLGILCYKMKKITK